MLCRVIRGITGHPDRYVPYVVKNNAELLDIRYLKVGSIITFVIPRFDLEETYRTCNWPEFITADGILGTLEYHKAVIMPPNPIWFEELTEENC